MNNDDIKKYADTSDIEKYISIFAPYYEVMETNSDYLLVIKPQNIRVI